MNFKIFICKALCKPTKHEWAPKEVEAWSLKKIILNFLTFTSFYKSHVGLDHFIAYEWQPFEKINEWAVIKCINQLDQKERHLEAQEGLCISFT